jgi:hypothetical protein
MEGKSLNLGSVLKQGISLNYKTALKLLGEVCERMNLRNNVLLGIGE